MPDQDEPLSPYERLHLPSLINFLLRYGETVSRLPEEARGDIVTMIGKAHSGFNNAYLMRDEVNEEFRLKLLTDALRIAAEAFYVITKMIYIEAIRAKIFTRREVAEALDVHENTVARWVKDPQSISKLTQELANKVPK